MTESELAKLAEKVQLKLTQSEEEMLKQNLIKLKKPLAKFSKLQLNNTPLHRIISAKITLTDLKKWAAQYQVNSIGPKFFSRNATVSPQNLLVIRQPIKNDKKKD